ncbi:hypothetical protein DFP72DRAFT_1169280 [Ephemerocybe angulata]|uniref:Uncharacterized protein n=1 Tax=Ephemerocybe angulata TaxID=980116 RepID=A0A8H6I0Q4_9AGAR|nr:hypothetical protein DFP72DRAFT_1169280 [Tulosesus angulatus]
MPDALDTTKEPTQISGATISPAVLPNSSKPTPASPKNTVACPSTSPIPPARIGSSSPPSGKHAPKVHNVFSNDGSFLERFQRLRRDDEERKKQQELLGRKKHFADRFKARGKRGHTEMSEGDSGGGSGYGSGSGSGSGSASASHSQTPETQTTESPAKKAKSSNDSLTSQPQPLNDYQKAMRNVNTTSCRP